VGAHHSIHSRVSAISPSPPKSARCSHSAGTPGRSRISGRPCHTLAAPRATPATTNPAIAARISTPAALAAHQPALRPRRSSIHTPSAPQATSISPPPTLTPQTRTWSLAAVTLADAPPCPCSVYGPCTSQGTQASSTAVGPKGPSASGSSTSACHDDAEQSTRLIAAGGPSNPNSTTPPAGVRSVSTRTPWAIHSAGTGTRSRPGDRPR
jgi:hypothetical protein